MNPGPRRPFEGEHLDLEYPCPWGYRVIGRDDVSLRAGIATVLGHLEYSVFEGRTSRRGRYISLEIEVLVDSEAQRHGLFHALAAHADIDFVL